MMAAIISNPQNIMVIVKRLVISLVIGFIAYEITKITLDAGFELPTSTPEISLFLLFVVTAFAGSFTGGGSSVSSVASAGVGRSDEKELGTVKWFNIRKGYGFITRDEGDDIFVHFRNIESDDRRAISEGQRVAFIVTDSEKGLQADKVTPA